MDESTGFISNAEFTVKLVNGDLYINGEYYRQLCWTPGAVAFAIANWLSGAPSDNELED